MRRKRDTRSRGGSDAERPLLRSCAEVAPILAQYIGETDREVFVVAMLTIRNCLIGLHTVSVGCLTSNLVHARELLKPLILSGSAALVTCLGLEPRTQRLRGTVVAAVGSAP
jgi:DNA repair protein RadC